MTCNVPGGYLSAFVDGVLGEAERRSLQAHLERCGDCRARVDELRALAALIRGSAAPVEAPDLLPATVAAIERTQALNENARQRLRHILGALLLVAGFAALAAAARQTTPLLLGAGVLRLLSGVLAWVVRLSWLQAWLRIALLPILLAIAWVSTRRLRRALHQVESGL